MNTIPIEISARHVHLNPEHWQALFGQTPIESARVISQPPQYIAAQRVTLTGPKGTLANVGIVGPLRDYSQAELAMTDARVLGLQPPMSASGHLAGAATVTVTGPQGSLTLPVAILQQRHIHASPAEAEAHSVIANQEVSVRVSGARGGVFDHVLVRVDPGFTWTMHIDTDEGNAFGITSGLTGELLT